jgi:hypothetical protein
MYGTLSPMIVPHKCCFIWLRHLSHLCISTTLKASGLSLIAIKLGLWRFLKSLDRLVCHVLFIQLVQWLYYSPIWIYLFILINWKKILRMSFEILDVAKWFQPSKIIIFGSRQQFFLWYLFIYLYFQWVTKTNPDDLSWYFHDSIAFIIPIRSSIMGNSLKNAKHYFMKLLILILTIIFFIETLIIRGYLFIYSFS